MLAVQQDDRVSAAPARTAVPSIPEDEPRLGWGRVIGLPVAAASRDEVTRAIIALARQERRGHYVCVANAHMLTLGRTDPDVRAIINRARVVTSDGVPLVWALHRQGLRHAERVSGPDLTLRLCAAAAAAGVPIYLYGGTAETQRPMREALRRSVPDLVVGGAEAPGMLPQRPPVDPEVVARINASGARIVFVGLGCPKQEHWMQAYAPHLDAVLIGVGQAFNLIAGERPAAPMWMQRHGLEWLYRLGQEPRRLWRRYLVGNTQFVYFTVLERLQKIARREPWLSDQGAAWRS